MISNTATYKVNKLHFSLFFKTLQQKHPENKLGSFISTLSDISHVPNSSWASLFSVTAPFFLGLNGQGNWLGKNVSGRGLVVSDRAGIS